MASVSHVAGKESINPPRAHVRSGTSSGAPSDCTNAATVKASVSEKMESMGLTEAMIPGAGGKSSSSSSVEQAGKLKTPQLRNAANNPATLAPATTADGLMDANDKVGEMLPTLSRASPADSIIE
eukprot:CAMPEP_0197669584 /NCGR_PEP_ID=MMETSP1338-20131121/72380_1 /TAXON_ID=43686 ORGANISM="Pelagodinium beii, Strain RCC1491" /NCGR_SAMPLE_ID=MMETSP1338 /ASSEMBLY_ACC=CAM_ASM_000754 /LENGTH=124 /DNA_ID=CAMNT_0043249173 /DNA_START=231 /DNA_END=605 /DNA_ORIENTATION=+